MRNLLSMSKFALIFGISTIGLSTAASGVASAQAMETAQRGAEIAPFAMTTIVSPDYGPHSNLGVVVGVDYTRFIRSIVQPSIEIRYTNATGNAINESSFSGGVKLSTSFHGIRPYGTLLMGAGTIKFVDPSNGYLGDTATVFSLGGGADFNITHSVRVRADFTHQSWACDPLTLTPVTLSLGVSYRLGFHSSGIER